MIVSMSGYGRAELERDGIRLTVEASSVNSRFCEVSVRLPRWLAPLEPKIRGLVQEYVTRGRVDLYLNWEKTDDRTFPISLDLNLVNAYYHLLNQMKERLNLPGEIDVGLIVQLPDIFKVEVKETSDSTWPLVEEVLRRALEELVAVRREEGRRLEADMRNRIEMLEQMVSEVERRAPERVEKAMVNLEERIKSLTARDEVDPQRLAMEAALLAERCDVTEECVRLHSHHQLFLSTLDQGGVVGRKLIFLLQEMNREANTIGSKANDISISHVVVKMKEEMEKLREQVQNVE